MQGKTSPESLSDTIGAIYDCVLAPQGWEAVLQNICRDFGFVTAALGVTSIRQDTQVLPVAVGMEPEMIVRAGELTPALIDLWGGLEQTLAFPIDEPIICSQVTDPKTWEGNSYYRAVGAPLDIYDGVAVKITNTSTLVGTLGFGVHRSQGAIDDSYVAGLRLLAPHIRRAVIISDLFNLKAIEASTFAVTIDALNVGVVLVDDNCAVVHANTAASSMLGANGPIRLVRGRLHLAHPAARTALETTVSQAARDEAQMGQRGIAIPISRENGEPCVLHVLPLKRGEVRRGIAQKATAALFIAPAAAPRRLPAEALTLIYDLTPAETRVFELISEGRRQAEIGQFLGVAASTVKTHLLRVFEKTGCRRQAELVRLAASLTLPLW